MERFWPALPGSFHDGAGQRSCSPLRRRTGKATYRSLGIRACLAGHRVAFGTAAEWIDRLGTAHDAGKLQDEVRRLGGCRW
jgi:hypothetical protein